MLSKGLLKLADMIDTECDRDDLPWSKQELIEIAAMIRKAYDCSLILEEELEGLRAIRDVVAMIAKSNGYESPAEKRRATFRVVGDSDTDTQTTEEEAQDG